MIDKPETVALLALAYVDLYADADADADDADTSLLRAFARNSLSEMDHLVARSLDNPEALNAILPELDQVRREAILHALADGEQGKWKRVSVPADLALAAGERWEEVDEAVERWRALGITATPDEVFITYLSAVEAATGMDRGEAISHFYFPEDDTQSSALRGRLRHSRVTR